ncbi:MAG TPA: DUF3306 domain-containing protein [Bosea sp. (in: a-proteobacteria)]|jgi:hypothetical protein|uniref:DUF3306 domain-containing protein n=1 Tax=Bosea sp. (in: a-proteobacteria) TaxID=1871050 RepID=UPI002E0DFA85|nr:DUF3306 domain-containing protein [Bosea sp. (in: a-proteobacteria)]
MAARGEGDGDDGFLGRWSRRKRAAAAEQAAPPAAPLPVPSSAPEPALPPEPEPEMIEPPSLDLVDKDFDLAHWLKQNVPESWKRAALRRAWESDPAISGYLDPARDYALDWNTPGGAPGYGPLSASDNVEEMIANIFGKQPEPAAESAATDAAAVRDDAADDRLSSKDGEAELLGAPQQEDAEQPQQLPSVRRSDAPDVAKTVENPSELPSPPAAGAAAVRDEPWSQPSMARPRRRGGGATPL